MKFAFLQTLITVTIMANPAIFYKLPCTWNYQLWKGVHSDYCPTAWTTTQTENIPEPQLMHANRGDKSETKFSTKLTDKLATNCQFDLRFICSNIIVISK